MEYLGFQLELKAAVDDRGQFEGKAAVYSNLDAYRDRIVPGAFTGTLATRGAERPLFWNHDAADVLGMVRLSDSLDALNAQGSLNLDVGRAREIYSLMRSGAVKGLSIGYRIPPGGAEVQRDGARVLKTIDVLEVSLTALPVNSLATVHAVKSIAGVRDFEKWLHTQGFSTRQARLLAADGWKGMNADNPEMEALEWLQEQNSAA